MGVVINQIGRIEIMKMSTLEKRFVNGDNHSRRVGSNAMRLLKHIPVRPGQMYLDVGTGNGAAPLEVAHVYDLRVTGLDVDPDQIALAEQRAAGVPHARFVTGSATDLPFEDGEFDIVATSKATHHIPNWPDAIAETVRVLKPGGYLVYSDLALPGWIAGAVNRLMARMAPGHAFPTPARLESVAAQHGLQTVYHPRLAFPYVAIWGKPNE
jgi:ubiquinone/menaquinone biosynthesis C-methylase UbiE